MDCIEPYKILHHYYLGSRYNWVTLSGHVCISAASEIVLCIMILCWYHDCSMNNIFVQQQCRRTCCHAVFIVSNVNTGAFGRLPRASKSKLNLLT